MLAEHKPELARAQCYIVVATPFFELKKGRDFAATGRPYLSYLTTGCGLKQDAGWRERLV